MSKGPEKTDVAGAIALDGDADNIKDFYRRWAASYDTDMSQEYAAARFIAELVHDVAQSSPVGFDKQPAACQVFDAGCGTGLVGAALAPLGYSQIDGVDLSPEMVAEAGKLGLYRELIGDVDLNKPLPADWKDRWDITTSCGVFTLGHVPPQSLLHLIEVTRANGLIAVSTRRAFYEQSDYQQTVARLIERRQLALIREHRDGPYTADSTAHYWVYRVIK